MYAWPQPRSFRCGEPALQRVFEPSFNTLVNQAQETIAEGAGAGAAPAGEATHLLHATRLVCGDRQLARRFLRISALGQTPEGYFLDDWPAFDRLNRIAQRQVGATTAGPLLEQGVTLAHAAWHHHLETGDAELPVELYPRLVRFFDALLASRGADGLLPVEGLGTKTVWIDGWRLTAGRAPRGANASGGRARPRSRVSRTSLGRELRSCP